MPEQKAKVYHPGIDVLRIIAILAVVLIHTTTLSLEVSYYNIHHNLFAFYLNQASRFAVPLFFMISGFVLELNYPLHPHYLDYLKKRISRIFIPYLFWTIIYYFFIFPIHQYNFMVTLITGNASYQLYFIVALLIFYLIFPIFHKFYRLFSHKIVLLLLLILQVKLLQYNYFINPMTTNNLYKPFAVVLMSFFFFIIGIVASHNQEQIVRFIKKWKILIFALAVFFVYVIADETYFLLHTTNNFLFFFNEWKPSIFYYSLLISCLLFYFVNNKIISRHVAVIKMLSKLSFFVFFVHVFVIGVIWNTIGIVLFKLTVISTLLRAGYEIFFFSLVSILSFLLAFIAYKIHLSKIAG